MSLTKIDVHIHITHADIHIEQPLNAEIRDLLDQLRTEVKVMSTTESELQQRIDRMNTVAADAESTIQLADTLIDHIPDIVSTAVAIAVADAQSKGATPAQLSALDGVGDRVEAALTQLAQKVQAANSSSGGGSTGGGGSSGGTDTGSGSTGSGSSSSGSDTSGSGSPTV